MLFKSLLWLWVVELKATYATTWTQAEQFLVLDNV